jgi:biotin carboxyl carrier protein
MNNYQININDKIFEIKNSKDNNSVAVNDKVFKVELLKNISDDFQLYSVNDKSFIISIKPIEQNKYIINFQNRAIEATTIDPYTNILQQYLANASSKNNLSHQIIKAPMPGLVIKILINEGDTVAKGDTLLIIEAMKMENAIKSNVNGTILNIKAIEGLPVIKDQVLIEISID